MKQEIHDPEVQLLAALAGHLEADYIKGEDPWADSPFGWIMKQQSRRRGAIGEQLVSGLLAAKNFDVIRCGDSQADRIVNGTRLEIKFSSLWQSGIYKFQQIRDQDYAVAFCLGISPFDAHAWAVPKSVLLEHAIGTLGQHGGADAMDTAWLSFEPDAPYSWMRPYGGRLRDAVEVLAELLPA